MQSLMRPFPQDMSTPNGYNNPAYSHQFDPSLYDYRCEAESPEQRRRGQQGRGGFRGEPPSDSSEFEGSDESNRSIIVEECNNRRVTLICEKRRQTEGGELCGGAYYQDISLESEGGHEGQRSYRHQRPLEPGEQSVRVIASCSNDDSARISRTHSFKPPPPSLRPYQRPDRRHRYEEIPQDDDCLPPPTSLHRYAEITPDENGYPTLSKEIQIQHPRDHSRHDNPPPKPRPISPIPHPPTFSPPRTPSTRDFPPPRFTPTSPPPPTIYSSSPLKSNSFEMSELSPPRPSPHPPRTNDHTLFIRTPKRHPPIGASAATDAPERPLLPRNLHHFAAKPPNRSHSLPNSPRKRKDLTTPPTNSPSSRKITHIFLKPTPPHKTTPARRNISNFFTDHPAPEQPPPSLSPYKPTTTQIAPLRTAVITPIFHRKNQPTFLQISHAFQSTGNIPKTPCEAEPPPHPTLLAPPRIKRNHSVPNFSHSLPPDTKTTPRYSRNLHLQYSPKKPLDHLTSVDKSRTSLIDQTASCSDLGPNDSPRCSLCFIFAAVVHLLTASATCAISFYLLSKVGRRYYLDFGLLAGFVNFVLGLLGFRSYCWRWIPNRNYVSGFVALAAFSAFTCGGLSYIVTARPLAGHPILDIMGGAICAVSVLTIVLALTGLTMSGCCKAPPPDNRVADV